MCRRLIAAIQLVGRVLSLSCQSAPRVSCMPKPSCYVRHWVASALAAHLRPLQQLSCSRSIPKYWASSSRNRVVRKGRMKCAALPPNRSGPYRAQDSGSARASVPVQRRRRRSSGRRGWCSSGHVATGYYRSWLITTAPVSKAWLGR
jgi:hypothetical protein